MATGMTSTTLFNSSVNWFVNLLVKNEKPTISDHLNPRFLTHGFCSSWGCWNHYLGCKIYSLNI